MNTNLTRVQVYLDPVDLLLLDELAGKLSVTRSQVIRDATKAVANRYAKAASVVDKTPAKKNVLLELVGFEKSKTGKVGLNIDEIYLSD